MNVNKVTIAIVLITAVQGFSQIDLEWADYLAAERAKLPVPGELLYNSGYLGVYRFGGSKRFVDVDAALPFGKAIQLSVPGTGKNPWELQFQTPANAIDIRKNDLLFYVFYIRALESSAPDTYGKAHFYVQRNRSPWTGLGNKSLTVLPEWQQVYVAVRAGESYQAGQIEVTIHLGYFKQKLEIGGLIALNLGPHVVESDLPQTPLYYDGMLADAAWRAEADARIEQHRKGDLKVVVTDPRGAPIENAGVSVQMQNHLYGFGTFMSELVLKRTRAAQTYTKEVLSLFNCATTPFYMGDGNWGWYRSAQNRENYEKLAGWLQDNKLPTKGHVLIWPAWKWMPPFFKELEEDPAGLKAAIELHLDTVVPVGAAKGLVQWDVVNEPHINHDVMDICGDTIMIDWYKRVHALHPEARLILNEYNIIMNGGVESFQDDFDYYIQLLLDGGAPLGGIGMQCHFDTDLTGIPRVLSILDRFAKYDLPIQITEFDIDTVDEVTQADYTRDFFTAVFSHPATDKIVLWGFWEGDQWKPNGAMIREDWSYKPNYYVYKDLIFGKWWTDEEDVSTADGSYSVRGFLGEYTITVSHDGRTVVENVSLPKEGATVEIQMPMTMGQ